MRVLLATDGSAAAGVGVELVASVAWPAGSAIEVVEAVPTETEVVGGFWPAIGPIDPGVVRGELTDEAKATLAAAASRVAGAGRSVTTSVLRGRPASAILDHARTTAPDLIVLGARGHNPISQLLLGSVSTDVSAQSPVPTLIARGVGLRRLVLAWDGSTAAGRAGELLTAWPIFAGAVVDVATVTELRVGWWTGLAQPGALERMPEYMTAVDAARAEHASLARTMADRLRAAGLDARPNARDGDAADELVRLAREVEADAIVMGTHGRTGLARLVLGSVARNVLQHAPCSVLVVRAPAGD